MIEHVQDEVEASVYGMQQRTDRSRIHSIRDGADL